jgi:hypothetical protein
MPWLVVALIAILAVGAGVAAISAINPAFFNPGGSTGSGEQVGGSTTSEVPVPMYEYWTDTAIWCATGDALDITVTGRALHNSDPSSEVGPDGLSDPYYHQWNVPGLPDTNTASVIGRLDTMPDGPFYVGYGTSYTCPADGQLQLGINDTDMSGNSGTFTAVITHTPAGEGG